MMGRAFAYGYGGYGCGGFGFMPMLLILLVLIVLIVIAVRWPQRNRANHSSEAMEILNQRLAKGEITTEEYEKLKKVITH